MALDSGTASLTPGFQSAAIHVLEAFSSRLRRRLFWKAYEAKRTATIFCYGAARASRRHP